MIFVFFLYLFILEFNHNFSTCQTLKPTDKCWMILRKYYFDIQKGFYIFLIKETESENYYFFFSIKSHNNYMYLRE